jgi:tetratricopeptide (TPR) repeat protein
MLADSLGNSSNFYVLTGEYDQALARSDEALRISQDIGNLWGQSYSQYYIGYVYFDRGEPDQAIKVMEACLRLGEQAGFVAAIMQMHGSLAFVYTTLGDIPRACAIINFAMDQLKESGIGFHPYIIGLLAYLHLLTDQVARAEALLQPFPIGDETAQKGLGGLFILLAHTELALKQGQYSQVAEMTKEFSVALRKRGIHQFLPDVLYARGQALLGQRNLEAAQRAFETARLEAEAVGSRRTLWQILAALSRIEAEHGHPAEARQLQQQARDIIEYIAAHIESPELRASFLNQPDVRAALEPLSP